MQPSEFADFLRMTIREEVRPMIKEFSQRPSDLPEYLTRQQTAKLLQISLVTLNEWSKQGVLQSLKIQGRIRYERSVVENAMQEVKNLRYKRK